MFTIEEQLEQFVHELNGSEFPNREWLKEPHIELYVRLTQHAWGGKMRRTLDLASINVDEAHQRKGHFTRILTTAERLAVKYGRSVYVESILNPVLIDTLRRRGYSIETDMTPCAILLHPDEEA